MQMGHAVVSAAHGESYEIAFGDLYECPACGATIIAGFGEPIRDDGDGRIEGLANANDPEKVHRAGEE